MFSSDPRHMSSQWTKTLSRFCAALALLGSCLLIAQTTPGSPNDNEGTAQAANQQSQRAKAAGNVCDEQLAAQAGPVYRADQGITPAKPVRTPDPKYPKTAVKTKGQGTVVLCLIVGPEGRVSDVRVARSLSPDLDDAAVKTVYSWAFAPATKNGRSVASQLWTEVSFRVRW